jgi:hypothetical protein
VTRLRAGRPGFDYRQDRIHCCFQTHSGAHPASCTLGTAFISSGVERPGREADHSLPSSAAIKNTWSCTSTPPYIYMAWCLVYHRDNFAFTIGCQLFMQEIRFWRTDSCSAGQKISFLMQSVRVVKFCKQSSDLSTCNYTWRRKRLMFCWSSVKGNWSTMTQSTCSRPLNLQFCDKCCGPSWRCCSIASKTF